MYSASATSRPPAPLPKERFLVKEDSLEYFIKFPTPAFRPSVREIDTSMDYDYISVTSETNIPIVLLLGWAGCQDRYLMKYSKIYEERG